MLQAFGLLADWCLPVSQKKNGRSIFIIDCEFKQIRALHQAPD